MILRSVLLILLSIGYTSISFAQADKTIIDKYIAEKINAQDLQNDYQNYTITSQHISSISDINHIYLAQTFENIKIEGSVASLHIDKSGKILAFHDQFYRNHNDLIIANGEMRPIQSVFAAVCETLSYGIPEITNFQKEEASAEQRSSFEALNVASNIIKANLVYQLNNQDKLILCWNFAIEEPRGSKYWSIKADVTTGEIIDKRNLTITCNSYNIKHIGHKKISSIEKHHELTTQSTSMSGAMYQVFPLGIESPNHGTRSLLSNPSNSLASPYEWHDTNGVAGAEYTITRGNNVAAREDIDGNNSTLGASPNGGASLTFDFPITSGVEPSVNQNAALTNLFYWNNIVHDITYKYGFTEAAGNFQSNNYGRGGSANDHVNADGLDGSGSNNANFSTPVDGNQPRMQMFLWNPASSNVITPSSISGNYSVVQATFGSLYYDLTEQVVLVNDGSASPTLACSPLTNGGSINGKIAILDRGNCEFGLKCLNAQNAGAVAVIVCNNVSTVPIAMPPGANGASVTIPCVMMSQSNCNIIKGQLANNVTMRMKQQQIDGDFDNGVIVHEYGHGISIRLTGGAANSSCLNNEEQMGEGWSDWYGLMLTMDIDDVETDGRGIGTYVLDQPTTGGGIRPFRYSTSMTVNPHTYESIKTVAVPHGVGSVWSAMLWELTWAMIREYGYDSDLYDGTGGNNNALKLVTEALKLQPCNPGFVNGRDALLAADLAINGGANQCLIWKSFAKRGLGFSASQGSTSSRSDGVQAFDMPTNCCKYVSNTSNTGNGSLRDAIACAISGDTIKFLNFIHDTPILLSGTSLTLTKDLTFYHDKLNKIIINNSSSNLPNLTINTGRNVILENIKINGSNGSGARAILNLGSLLLNNASIEDTSTSGQTMDNRGNLVIEGNVLIKKN